MTRATTRIAVVAVAALSACALAGTGVAHADHSVTELVSVGPAGGNGPFDIVDFRLSADGAQSYLTTAERLVAEDTDDHQDLYRRVGGQTTLVSTGPAGGSGPFDVRFFRINNDGSRAVFSTAERLTSADTDDQIDLYLRSGGVTTLVSTGPAGGNGPVRIDLAWISDDGTSIVFETAERLTASDDNSVHDFYLWRGGQTTLLTDGPVTNREFARHFVGMSANGRRVFFSTPRNLTGSDNDGDREDTYKWEDGVVTIESVGTNGENGSGSVNNFSQRIDETGSRLIFFSTGALDPAYPVGGIFERANGITRLVSLGPNGPDPLEVGSINPAGRGISADGSHIYFYTYSRLVDADTDSEQDIYVRAGGVTRLVTGGPLSDPDPGFQQAQRLHGISTDGRRAVFDTDVRLTPEDVDGTKSLYENVDGVTRWLAPSGQLAGVSDDASRVFFVTFDSLVPSDTFGDADLYEIHGGQTSVITATDGGDPCKRDFGHPIVIDCPVSISRDGRRVLFWHSGELLAGDTDRFRYDVYLAEAPAPEPARADYKNGPAFCRALREFLGEQGFADRYGAGANAFGKCVSGGAAKRASK